MSEVPMRREFVTHTLSQINALIVKRPDSRAREADL